MQADDYFLYDQLRRTVTCLRDRLTQAEERLHDLVVGTGGRGQLMQAGGDTYSHLLQTMEFNNHVFVRLYLTLSPTWDK